VLTTSLDKTLCTWSLEGVSVLVKPLHACICTFPCMCEHFLKSKACLLVSNQGVVLSAPTSATIIQ
jgi:hypothetical protein